MSVRRAAIVTGAASGIGRAVAQHLAAAGIPVGLLDLDDAAVRTTADEIARTVGGVATLGAGADVADRASVRAAVDTVRDALGPVTVIVTSAGVETAGAVTEISDEDWDRTLAVNLTGTFTPIQAVVPDMKAAGWGRIVTISSSSAQSGAPRMAAYVASKGGVIALTKALSVDLAPKGITANTIPPSIVDTPMSRRAGGTGVVAFDGLAERTPVRRLGTPDDIASMAAYLCSDAAGFITGQVIGVNGGWYL